MMGKKKKYEQIFRETLCNISGDISELTYNSDDIDDSKINVYNQGFCKCKAEAQEIVLDYIMELFGANISIKE